MAVRSVKQYVQRKSTSEEVGGKIRVGVPLGCKGALTCSHRASDGAWVWLGGLQNNLKRETLEEAIFGGDMS